jgi:hypothetical protein
MTQAQSQPGDQMSDAALRAASAERDQVRDPERGHAIIDYLLKSAGEDYVAGLEAALLGSPDTLQVTPKGEAGPFWSVKGRQIDLLSLLLNRLISELEKNALYSLWTGGGPDFDRDVARALWQIGKPEGGGSAPQSDVAPSEQAVATAKIIHRFLELARKAQNAEAGYEPAYPGGLISNGHDGLKLRRAGKADWIAFVRPLLDPQTYESFDPEELLDLAWEAYDLYQDPDIQLRFKDADSWIAYNARFGLGTLRDAVVAALERSARRAGLRAVFGSDPEHTLEGVLRAVEAGTRAAIPPDDRAWLQAALASLAPVWPLGILGANAERELAGHAREGLIELGEALFSEAADLPAFATMAAYQGTTLLEAIDAQLAVFASAKAIAGTGPRADFALASAVFAETFNAALAQRFVAFDLPPGKGVGLLRQFLKLNVTYWWSELQRRAALTALRAYVSRALQQDAIDAALAATLAEYGVDAARWEAIRKSLRQGAEPQSSDAEAPMTMIEAWLWDRVMVVAMPAEEPIHERLRRGVADFTVEGELLRFMAQLRELRAPFPPKLHGTMAAREGDRAVMQALMRGDTLPALTSLLIWMVLFARLTRFGFDLAEGQAPPVRKDEWPWHDAAMAGGALGLVADLLFGETTGLHMAPLNAIATLDHPSVDSALDTWRAARAGEDVRGALAIWAKQEGDANALDTLQVTRQAMNATLLHQLQDMMSPGYLSRTAKEMQDRAADAYWRTPGGSDQ